MRITYIVLLLISSWSVVAQSNTENRIVSTIDSSRTPELVLTQSFEVDANIQSVWDAYTTKAGWESWAAPLAEVDLKLGGTIKTNYNPSGKIGDATTNTVNIINYVPYKILTLQAELTESFPAFMKEDAEHLFNVISFVDLGNDRTRVESYGIGYRNTPKYLELMNYFIPANEGLLNKLITILERK